MAFLVCWKCKRSIETEEKQVRDPKTKKVWTILTCPYERCKANLDIFEAPKVKLWNGTVFENEY